MQSQKFLNHKKCESKNTILATNTNKQGTQTMEPIKM